MNYVCMECGADMGYDQILRNRLKCTKCQVKRSNIWVKQRPQMTKTVIAR